MFSNKKYFEPPDPQLFSPSYFGRKELLNCIGDYFASPWQPGVVIVLSEQGLRAFVNVCRHRQAIILSGSGNISNVRCAMHGWEWDLNGKSKICPGFDCKRDLLTVELEESGGWIYAPSSGFRNAIPNILEMEMAGYNFFESNTIPYACSWIEYVDVYLDVNHVRFIHPGFRSWVDCSKAEVKLGDGWSIHSVPIKNNGRKSGSSKDHWSHLFEGIPNGEQRSVHWIHIFPNIFIENYGGYFIITTIVVPNEEGCVLHDEIWVRPDLSQNPDFVNSILELCREIEGEDAKLVMATRKGREALRSIGLDDSGPYQQPLELGLQHFHQWLLNRG